MKNELNAKLNNLCNGKYQGKIIYITIDNIDNKIIPAINDYSLRQSIKRDIQGILDNLKIKDFSISFE